MDLKERVQLSMTVFGLFSAYCLYSISDALFIGSFFAAIGAYCHATSFYYFKLRRRSAKRLYHQFNEPQGNKGMYTLLMILSFSCGFVFVSLASDCLAGVFI